METNIIKAIINLVQNPITELMEYSVGHNRVNNMGETLEEYIKDIFADTVNEINPANRMRKISECFSYLGNQNNPPDSIIRNGDAIEVKKIEGQAASLALNSSFPKAKLFSNSDMITVACRRCEEWTEKDIIYAVGVVKNSILSSLYMVYGVDYAASEEIYIRIKTVISTGVNSIPGVEFSQTKELGHVSRVDPLGITYLRVRGMWGIENPTKVFDYIYQRDTSKNFNFMALINMDKYASFAEDTQELERISREIEDLIITDVELKTPDNPAILKRAKMITFKI